MGPQRIELAVGQWLRFDRYELRERTIAPAKGATCRIYDPWKLAERPYVSLAKIVLQPDASQLPAENPALVNELLGWAAEYGLLGTIRHRVQMVSLWPRWSRIEFADGEPRDLFEPAQEVHVNLVSNWLMTKTAFRGNASDDVGVLGKPLEPGEIPNTARRPSALVRTIEGSTIEEEPLSKSWASYFPDVPYDEQETYAYPHLAGEEFWNLYAEPVHEFVRGAWLLANGIEAITQPKHEDAPRRGAERLSLLAQYGAPRLTRREDGTFVQQWEASSLLSMLAFMAIEDITGRLLHQCPTCRRFFARSTLLVEYCSPQCRQTMQKRRHRERLKMPAKPRAKRGAKHKKRPPKRPKAPR